MRSNPEAALRRMCVGYLQESGWEVYDTDVGYLYSVKDGRVVPRPGGTRTRSGFPDLVAYGPAWRWLLTVECKGPKTGVSPEQWRFAEERCRRGEPHLIVRSLDALRVGMRWLGLADMPSATLLANALQRAGDSLPLNVNALALTVERYAGPPLFPLPPTAPPTFASRHPFA